MGDISNVIDIDSIADELEYLYGTKQAIADAINEVGESQGITVTSADTFRSYADKIKKFGQCEVGKISVRTTPEYDDEIGRCKTFEAPEGKVWKEVKVHIDAWSAVTDDVDPLIISENGYFDVNEVSAAKFDYSEVQNPTGNPKQKGYYIRINGKYYPTEDTEVDPNKTYYIKDGTKEYETASSFIINVQRQGAAPFTCEFCDAAGNVIETHRDIPYGGWCNFEGETPTSQTGLMFHGWNPPPNNIQSNRKCYPRFFSPTVSLEEWPESWAEIVAKHGEGIPVGAWKMLPLTDNYVTLPDGVSRIEIRNQIIMQKVYDGEDVSTSSWLTKNTIVWYAVNGNTLSVKHTMHNYEYKPGNNSYAPWGMEQDYTNDNILNDREFFDCFMKIIPDYIRQFIVPVTKYTTVEKVPEGENMHIKNMKTQDYIWVPSLKELNVDNEMASERCVIYSGVFTDNNSRKKGTDPTGSNTQTYVTREACNKDRWGNPACYLIDTIGQAAQTYVWDIPRVIGFCL